MNKLEEIIHLLNRSGFGPSSHSLKAYFTLSYAEAVEKIISESTVFSPITWRAKDSLDPLDSSEFSRTGGEKRVRIKNRNGKQTISLKWLMEMIHGSSQLRERMAFFWHDHFAASGGSPKPALRYLNKIRKYSLGSFKDLLFAVAKDGLMIYYLNNKQNINNHPNENFAREVMELFTMGIGNYTEADVQEAARAFTGWTVNKRGEFKFNKNKHDDGLKTFLGQTGRFTGDDILEILVQQPQTAVYITDKIFCYLVGHPLDEATLSGLANEFMNRNYDIKWLVQTILLSKVFRSKESRGQKIKSPIDLLVGLCRLLGLSFGNTNILFKIQYKLKQTLLYPPNVSGWPEGKRWIDIESISDRLQLADTLINNRKLNIKKNIISLEGDESVYAKKGELSTSYNDAFFQNIMNQDPLNGLDTICTLAYGCTHDHLDHSKDEILKKYNSKIMSLKDVLVYVFSQPEYQLN